MPKPFLHHRPHPEAARFIDEAIASLRSRSSSVDRLARRLRDETGTRLVDWLDHLALPADEVSEGDLRALGFSEREEGPHPEGAWVHDEALLPPIARTSRGHRLALGVDSVTDFLLAQGAISAATVEGPPFAPLRRASLFEEDGVAVFGVERHGAFGFEPRETSISLRAAMAHHYEVFLTRPRDASGEGEREALTAARFEAAVERVRDAQATLGEGLTLSLFFRAERAFWQSRNHAARVQKARQDALGLGWANHDHHTYRSSRASFHRLLALMEALGLARRERFYAGAEAGWGAQVLEHPAFPLVVFADVDLSPDEVEHDFSAEPLPSRDAYGTVGLWCALHGESALGAGMHHLECQFDFDAARAQLVAAGVPVMDPFTELPMLRQAFTEAERWPVDRARLDALTGEGAIDADSARRMGDQGALGSHLEILERRDGYRGFNQEGISDIIARTDPRAR